MWEPRERKWPTRCCLGLPRNFLAGSDGKESACILSWRVPMDRGADGLQSTGSQRVGQEWTTKHTQAAPVVKNLPANAGGTRDAGLSPGSGRSPGEGNGNPLQRSFRENFHVRRRLQCMGSQQKDVTEQLTHTHTHTHLSSFAISLPEIV